MLQIKAPRALLRNVRSLTQPLIRQSSGATFIPKRSSQLRSPTITSPVVLTSCRPLSLSVARREIDRKHEKEISHTRLAAHPERVSSTSSVTPVLEAREEADTDMLAGIRSDIVSRIAVPLLLQRLTLRH